MSRVWIFYPPLPKMTGGMVVLLQIARQLQELGVLAGVVVWEKIDLPDFPVFKHSEALLRAGDILLVPEGWVNAVSLGVQAGCRVFVYCQNWAYLFHGLPPAVRWQDLPVSWLAVSDPVAWYMEQVLRKKPVVIRPAIDTEMFYPSSSLPEKPIRVAFMPRKNKALAEQIMRIFAERNPKLSLEWVAIDKLDQNGVAQKLRSSHIFLVSGFPEGCPLPPLEAMASGCFCVGFTGFGGLDYMRQIAGGWQSHIYTPRKVSWGGNGWWTADGDVLEAALALEKAVVACREKMPVFEAELMLTHYSFSSQKQEIKNWLAGL